MGRRDEDESKDRHQQGSQGQVQVHAEILSQRSFFLHEDEDVYKRDVSGATLEDRFDKTVLPKVMHVKNFGRSGRTKYTHLVDQDTTQFDAAWAQESATNQKFLQAHAGGMKQTFDKPGKKKERK